MENSEPSSLGLNLGNSVRGNMSQVPRRIDSYHGAYLDCLEMIVVDRGLWNSTFDLEDSF